MKIRTGFILSIVLFLSFLLKGESLRAQNVNRFTLYAEIVDAQKNEPLVMATVSLKNYSDTTKVRYGSADENGKLKMSGIAAGKYVFVVEYMGYHTYRRVLQFSDKSRNLGKIAMTEDINLLDGAVVSAMATPIVVKKDTLEYTAASYNITVSETLEDLIKKMPGFEVDEDGKITSNGEEIREVRINGEKFFLNDPKIATKNLPAAIVDKLHVIRKKSDQAEFTGIDDGKESTIIDVKVKKDMMGGWFGNVLGGYGYGDGLPHRFEAGAMAATIGKGSQLAVLGSANNTNNRGFNDFAGNMMNSMMQQNIGAIHSQIYARNKGIMTSYMAGVNGSKSFKGGKLKINGSYLFTGSDSDKKSESNKETFLEAGNSLFNANGDFANTRSFGHMLGGEIDWKFDDRNSILIKPQVNIGHGNFDQQSDYSTGRGARGANDADGNPIDRINDGHSLSAGNNFSVTAGSSFLYRHRFQKKGRTLSVYADYNYTQNTTDGLNQSITNQYENGMLRDSSVIDQQYNLASRSSALTAEVKYTEPFAHDLYLQASYEYRQIWSDSDKKTFEQDAKGEYVRPVEAFTDSFRNMFINQTGTVLFGQSREKYRFQVGADVQPSYTSSRSSRKEDLVRNVVNFAPRAMFEYDFSDNNVFKMRYRGETVQPSINQLQPVADNSNPLVVVMGNPDLLPEFTHRLRFSYKYSNPRNFFMIEASLRGTYTSDKITSLSWYDDKGIKYSRPINEESPVFGSMGYLMMHIPIGKSGFSITNSTYAMFDRGYSYIADRPVDQERIPARISRLTRSADSGWNPDDLSIVKNNVKTLNVSEWLKFRYRNRTVEASIGGYFRYSNAWYSIDRGNPNATWNNAVTASVSVNLPWGLYIKTDCKYNFYVGFDEGYNDPAVVWNAELSKTLFKGKGTLAVKAFDMLNQSKNVYRVSQDDYVMDVNTNALKRYVILEFSYRFGDFSKMGRPSYGGKGGHGGRGGYGKH